MANLGLTDVASSCNVAAAGRRRHPGYGILVGSWKSVETGILRLLSRIFYWIVIIMFFVPFGPGCSWARFAILFSFKLVFGVGADFKSIV